MLDRPEITSLPRALYAYVHVTVPRDRIQEVMGPGIEEVMKAVSAQGVGPTGPWFTRHRRMDPAVFDFEIAVPVSAPFQASGRVVPGERRELPKVARTIYTGPYEGLGAAWGDFMAWIAAEGHEPAADLFETYLRGPESGPDASTYRTELVRPLAR